MIRNQYRQQNKASCCSKCDEIYLLLHKAYSMLVETVLWSLILYMLYVLFFASTIIQISKTLST
jgi:hypothetical protein